MSAPGDAVVIDLDGLQQLIELLQSRGYAVIGPTVRDGVITHAPISGVQDLPQGWTDDQSPGTYRLRRRDDEMLFGYVVGAQSWKTQLFPPRQLLWRAPAGEQAEGPDEPPLQALLGVRSCDLHALARHDTVLASRAVVDEDYVARRRRTFVVAVACSDPSTSCFCTSMGTGPKPDSGYDLSLTELLSDAGHSFLLHPGSEQGQEVLTHLTSRPATAADVDASDEVTRVAVGRISRTMRTDGLRDLLYASQDSTRWDEIADRCLSCGNCTLVCPTCFCTSAEDTADLATGDSERWRVWDSCFNEGFSHLHGGSVRASVGSRYRQWMTHKLGSWWDQFGESGCIGCGRCISWCPVGIDITDEVDVLATLATDSSDQSGADHADHR